MAVEIRRYEPADEPAVLDILDEGLRAQTRYAAQISPPEDAGFFEREWAACVAALHDEPGDWWVAADGGEIAGVLWLEQTADLFVPYHTVQQIAVREARRGEGIGRAMLAFAERHARDAGSMVLMIGGLASNPAMALYRRLGFEDVPEGYREEDNPNHVLLWKRFRPGRSDLLSTDDTDFTE